MRFWLRLERLSIDTQALRSLCWLIFSETANTPFSLLLRISVIRLIFIFPSRSIFGKGKLCIVSIGFHMYCIRHGALLFVYNCTRC